MMVWTVACLPAAGLIAAWVRPTALPVPKGVPLALGLALGLALVLGAANLARDLAGRARWKGRRAQVWESLLLAEAALCLVLILAASLLAWMLLTSTRAPDPSFVPGAKSQQSWPVRRRSPTRPDTLRVLATGTARAQTRSS